MMKMKSKSDCCYCVYRVLLTFVPSCVQLLMHFDIDIIRISGPLHINT